MNYRPFDWRDLSLLHRLRDDCLYLDSTLVLKAGPVFAPASALLAALVPGFGVATWVGSDQHTILMGQATHPAGQPSAHLSFLTPRTALDSAGLPGLLDHLAAQASDRGALHLLADVEEDADGFAALRNAGFGIYARQRIWRLVEGKDEQIVPGLRGIRPGKDHASVRFLYFNLVPGLVQQVESPSSNRLQGLVYYQGNELLAFIELRYGPSGIWAQPFIHPDAEKVAERILQMLKNLPFRAGRPVFVCVRSYQSWLEPVVGQLGAELYARQAVMVRHLAVTRKVQQTSPITVLNGKTPEPTVPVAQYKK
jgi:hypothetical protein